MKSKLSWHPDEYIPSMSSLLMQHTEKEIRAEYTRLRDIAQKRIGRLAESEFTYTEAYKQNKEGFKKLSEIEGKAELAKALSKVAGFVNAKTSSIAGLKHQRSEAIKSLHEHGYTFVNKTNFREFTEFMEQARAKLHGKMYDSDRVAEVFATAEKKGVPPEELEKDFKYWLDEKNLAALEALKLPEWNVSSVQLKKEVGKEKRKQTRKKKANKK